LRHPPVGETNGWYIRAGEYSSGKHFSSHCTHLISLKNFQKLSGS
jgi:hypothetical protein